jgi:pSer/pThr/pTyr-binding forkhead associated (FHA) protein
VRQTRQLDVLAGDIFADFFRIFERAEGKNMKARLFDARHGNREIPLEKLPVLLGRGNDAGIQVLDGFASRRHCEISERDGALFVRDLESKNGCFVNGCYASETASRPGDKLAVGATTFVVFYDPSEETQN